MPKRSFYRTVLLAAVLAMGCAPDSLEFSAGQGGAAAGGSSGSGDAMAPGGAAGIGASAGAGGSAGAGPEVCGPQGAPKGQWCLISAAGAPAPRQGAGIAAWSGSELIVWGGRDSPGTLFADGGRYLPETNEWQSIGAPAQFKARAGHAVFWAGGYFVAWGGGSLGEPYFKDGARYDPVSEQWLSMAPPRTDFAARDLMSVASNGSVGVIWGGCGGPLGDGALYDPALDSWSQLPDQRAPSARCGAPAAWVKQSGFVLYGGTGVSGSNLVHSDGGGYSTNSGWTPSDGIALGPRSRHALVVVGASPIVWGGSADYAATQPLNSGAVFELQWSALPVDASTPTPRFAQAAVATNDEMIVWGGEAAVDECLNDGARYNLALETWTKLPPAPLSARSRSAAVWTGSELIVWGGCCASVCFNDGARYRP